MISSAAIRKDARDPHSVPFSRGFVTFAKKIFAEGLILLKIEDMKIKLRVHERIFVTLLGAIALTRYLLPMILGSVEDFEMPDSVAFAAAHFPLHLFRNVLLPDIGTGLLIYLCYLWINRWVVPFFLPPSGMFISTSKLSLGRKGFSLKGMGG